MDGLAAGAREVLKFAAVARSNGDASAAKMITVTLAGADEVTPGLAGMDDDVMAAAAAVDVL